MGSIASRMAGIGRAFGLLVRPLEPDRARALADRWGALDPRWKSPYQSFGTKMTGCTATIGMHPRCDFACTGCYLGDDANRIAPFPMSDLDSQLDRIRAWTGPKGNLQLTDGEVTLRPADDLIEITRRARRRELIPMLMTHGDIFRKDPALLRRLVVEGGLTEISVHVDITMRGRLGFRNARTEEDLLPLREEFAGMIRAIRRETGRDLRSATTMTITPDNLRGLAAVTRWCADNRDAFRMLSLQPVADVGRTRDGIGGVDVDAMWAEVARGLAPFGAEAGDGGPIHVGHPACNRIASFFCVERPGSGRPARFVKTIRAGRDDDRRFLEALRATGLMGIGYRDDPPLAALARRAGAIARALPFVAGTGRRFVSGRLGELGLTLSGTVARALSGRLRIDGFSVVSHHFMSRSEIDTPVGRERLDACVFRLPVGDRMVSMCEVNLSGLREAIYAQGHTRSVPPLPGGRGSGGSLPVLPDRIAS